MNLIQLEEAVAALLQLRTSEEQEYFLLSTGISGLPLVKAISEKIRQLLPSDPDLARVLAETNLHLASSGSGAAAYAYAYRSQALVLYMLRQSAEAEVFFDKAVRLFEAVGLEAEAGRTLVGQMDNLIYLSRYRDALAKAKQAQQALEEAGNAVDMARLDTAVGNLYYRLNRYDKALRHYDRAREALDASGDTLAVAIIGLNRAYVLTELNRFDEAVASFEFMKEHCERHGMTPWAAIADRGISQMHFRRGNYSTALTFLEQARRKHAELNDSRRVGLCDMDRAEIYLELNLFRDAAAIARGAFETFESLGNKYEAAKCLVYEGIAQSKLGEDELAEDTLYRAHEMFRIESNEIWMATVDLWQVELLIRFHRFQLAQCLAERAAEVFEQQKVPARAAAAHVLSAHAWLELGEPERALSEAEIGLSRLEGRRAPWVSYQCYNVLGLVKEAQGAFEEAARLYTRAIEQLESLRGSIGLDEMRMSFGRDKYRVYERAAALKLAVGDIIEAFILVERSKSRTLIDLMEKNLETVWSASSAADPALKRLRRIREELNILYRRLNRNSAPAEGDVLQEITQRERELLDVLRENRLKESGFASLQSCPIPDVAAVQTMLDPDEVLLEYYTTGSDVHVFVVTSESCGIATKIASMNDVRSRLRALNFQLSKFHLGDAYTRAHSGQLLLAVQHHLRELHRLLIEPVADQLKKRSLVIVPHQSLHYVPFDALYDGDKYLIDQYDIVRAPSAAILKICREKTVPPTEHDLILAVSDESTPHIDEEVNVLRELLPAGLFFIGAEAREEVIRRYGPTAGKLHIAAHGIFRQDNPMFSSLKLGDEWLNLFDIFNLSLGAELTVLSACETGLNAVLEGDELLGLARGFLYAGTPSLLVSLWTVNDRSTAMLMRHFYAGLNRGLSKPAALREAVILVKAEFPHPYYWAPFVLMGRS